MTVVTGATGHLGQALLAALSARDEKTAVLLRSRAQHALVAPGTDIHYGDIGDRASLVRAFTGADIVFHSAALIAIVSNRYKELYRVNVEGTKNVIDACREARVKRLVYTSSVEALGIASPGSTVTEAAGFNPDHVHLEYAKTKALASMMVQKAADVDPVIVSPTAIIGPYDRRPSALGRMIYDAMTRRLIGYPDGGFDFVDVRDAADLHLRAAQRGRTGEHYLASGSACTVHELMLLIERISGVRRPLIRLSRRMAALTARIMEIWYALSGTDPMFTVKAVEILADNPRISSDKAKRELGYSPRPLETTIADTIQWFRENPLH